ncbi:hypothetical protein Enr13x_46580 [Stieleria neptunia]|uniref:Uncharacterized protein n=1 Tax=Stieleria neptunia TaxID=2527979 RepID=A0A518HVE9_9BACT|nr:hypothetical protein [Stieleria neptunia]QDV44787.1 hypothetical protein Enr13x_46580 [Stieleria neptunia]
MSHRHLRLMAVILGMLVVWGVVLPRLATTRTVRERTLWLEQHQIDPAAMYYTELPLMDRILAKERSFP